MDDPRKRKHPSLLYQFHDDGLSFISKPQSKTTAKRYCYYLVLLGEHKKDGLRK